VRPSIADDLFPYAFIATCGVTLRSRWSCPVQYEQIGSET